MGLSREYESFCGRISCMMMGMVAIVHCRKESHSVHSSSEETGC